MKNLNINDFEWQGYSPCHPWFYVLGGEIRTPKQIIKHVQFMEYKGYLADHIQAVAKRSEPFRSKELKKIKEKVIKDYRQDLSRYRSLANKLRTYRKTSAEIAVSNLSCEDIHMNISLKYNHLINDFAHLLLLENSISYQMTLF